MTLQRTAAAKVNLGLAVTGIRPDGYHELRSVFLRVGLSDRLDVIPGPPGMALDALHVEGDADCPVDGNLVLRASALVRELVGAPLPALRFQLDKRIPVAAGLGGGSSDAAAALRLACAAWGVGIHAEPAVLASRLGADVPFFFAGGPAAGVSGAGERLEPLPGPDGGVGVLLVTPPERLSTARVFAVLDELERPGHEAATTVEDLARAFASGLDGGRLAAWSERLAAANDLWLAAVRLAPGLERTRAALEEALRRPVLLTGSGPTLVALYPSVTEAADEGRALAAALPSSLHGSRLVATDDVGPHPIWRYP